MRFFPLALTGLLLVLPSCDSLFSEEYMPEYMKETTPLDPPGTEAARKAMRLERVKEGKFETGSSVPVQGGRVFLLSRNPEYNPEPEGRLVEAAEAKILSCEGLYYFVELEDGKRGYLRESDFEQPAADLLPTDPMLAGGLFLPGEVEGGAPVQLDDNQVLTTNEDGRAVVLVGKKSDRAAEFERRRQAVEKGEPLPLPAPQTAPAAGADEEPPPLPEPAGDGPSA